MGSVRLHGRPGFDSDSACNATDDQWRWLSVPESRLVLNPSADGWFRLVPATPDLALHVGYHVGAEPRRLLDLVRIGLAPVGDAPDRQWRRAMDAADLDRAAQDEGGRDGVAVSLAPDATSLCLVPEREEIPWGHVQFHVDRPGPVRDGWIRVTVSAAEGHWTLKINSGQAVDTVVHDHSSEAGTFVVSLANLPHLQEPDGFDVKFFAVGQGLPVRVESIEVVLCERPPLEPFEDLRTRWYPSRLEFEAEHAERGVRVSGSDFFFSTNSIARVMHVTADAAGTPEPVRMLMACADAGMSVERQQDGAWLFSSRDGGFHWALCLAGRGLVAETTTRVSGNWALPFSVPGAADAGDGTECVLGLGFATAAEGRQAAVDRARDVCRKGAAAEALRERKTEWERFGLRHVDPEGVSPDRHRLFYYGAWTFAIANLLPPLPEADCPFPQTPTGKPSLWAFGASRAKVSAAWESFFGQQLLAWVKPEAAWDAFEGIMLQVDEHGWLDGECLPSRKAQTAWILYHFLPDRERLERVYPPIRRYLFWREQNPRWIYLEHDYADQKDASFVDHLLVDIDFAKRIARELGLPSDEVEMWDERSARIRQDYREWFFSDDGSLPNQLYYTDSGTRGGLAGDISNVHWHPTWVASGLHIPNLDPDLVADLRRIIDHCFDPTLELGGFSSIKYPTLAFDVYGLLEHDEVATATAMMEIALRDIVRGGEFAECYNARRYYDRDYEPGAGTTPIASAGVQPSLFGAAMMIDFTLMLNGVRIDQGAPEPLDP
jgi:hypothetical protein